MNHQQQSTCNILMICPASFGFNEQTADSNAFQTRNDDGGNLQEKALHEFDGFVEILRANGVNVIVIEDTEHPHKPDSIFPNNWVSFHEDGALFLYPMKAENRRLERREDIISNFNLHHVVDLSHFETEGKYLEGTGSMVLDRENKIVYACLSPRTNEEVLNVFCRQTGYSVMLFHAFDEQGIAIYHTNVLMGIGTGFAVICADSITDPNEQNEIINALKTTGKEIITISFDQMNRFAGNLLEVKNKAGETLIVMSKSAFDAYDNEQKLQLSNYGKLVYADISTIEKIGGGSARCMMAEVFLPNG